MKYLLIGAAVFCLAIATAKKSENEESKGLSCSDRRAIEQNNKKIVEGLFGAHDLSSLDKYIHPDVIEHNPGSGNGIEAFKLFAAEWENYTQQGKIDIRRISAEGDLVWVHAKTSGHIVSGKDLASIDIFKLTNGKVVEHWDVAQPIPDLKESKNPHPFF